MNNLKNYINSPKNPTYNFLLGKEYEDAGHTAAAIGFYIRTAENSENDLLSYEALLRTALCLSKQGSRVFTVKGILLRAISLLPNRPEGYFLLARVYEENKDWQECYTWSCIGESKFDLSNIYDKQISLKTNVEYPGTYGFVFEKAVSAWYIGLYSESAYLFRMLNKHTGMLPGHRIAVTNNIKNFPNTWQEPLEYTNDLYEFLKYKFPNSKQIKKNYSQCYQDMFVLSMLNGKRSGMYLEIGCGDPFYGNNTALLEEFNWIGTSIDIAKETTDKWVGKRKNLVITGDALQLDLGALLKTKDIDYLQIDIDPALASLEVLFKIPFDKHRFAVITFEHDAYQEESGMVKQRSRNYLRSLGYQLVIADVAPNKYNEFEDWWIHPELVDEKIWKQFITYNDGPKKANTILINKH